MQNHPTKPQHAVSTTHQRLVLPRELRKGSGEGRFRLACGQCQCRGLCEPERSDRRDIYPTPRHHVPGGAIPSAP